MQKEVKGQSDIAEAEAKEAFDIANSEVEKTVPYVKQATDGVDKLDKDSLITVKTLKVISNALRETCEAISI